MEQPYLIMAAASQKAKTVQSSGKLERKLYALRKQTYSLASLSFSGYISVLDLQVQGHFT